MKNTNSKLILSLFLSFAVLSFANGQQKAIKERADRLIETGELITVKGTVTAFNKYYVMNAEVTARKTRSKANTDSLGRFEIMVSGEDVLFFKANGFEKNRRKVSSNEDEISVNMILMPGEKYRNIVVAFGHMYEENIAKIQEASATSGLKLFKKILPGDLKFSFFLGLLFNFMVISLI